MIRTFVQLHIKMQHFTSNTSECNIWIQMEIHTSIALRYVIFRNEVLHFDVQIYKNQYHSDSIYYGKIFEWHDFKIVRWLSRGLNFGTIKM